MTNKYFILETGPGSPLKPASAADEYRIPLGGHSPTVSTGDTVAAGQKIAELMQGQLGDLHSPCPARIREITRDTITLMPCEGDRIASEEVSGISGDELASVMREKGLDITGLFKARILIINAVPPEPCLTTYGRLMSEYRDTVAKGLGVIKKITSPSRINLIAVEGDAAHFGNCTVELVKPIYPAGLDPLVIRKFTGLESNADAAVIDPLRLYAAGRIIETGLPWTQTALTVNGQNFLAPVGTPVHVLLKDAGITVNTGDRVILGGPMRGEALHDLNRGIGKLDHAITVIAAGKYAPTTDNPCLNCGECVLRCPSRIMPNLISRCAEFKLFERTREMHVEACMECGICGFYCPGRRPLLQYIRLAKKELAEMDQSRLAADKPNADEEASS